MEIVEVGVDVQRETVHSHEAGAFHPDGAYLAFSWRIFVNPNSGGTFHTFSFYTILRDSAYHCFFKQMDIVFNTEVVALQVDNGVCHELTGTVERNVAATGYLDKLHSGQLSQHILGMTVTSKCEHRRVLDEDEPTGGFHHTVFALAGGQLFGLHSHPGGGTGGPFDEHRTGLDHLAFACADRSELKSWARRLDELGIEHGGIVDAHYGSGLSFRDPDGIALEFFAPPAGSGEGEPR